MNKKGALAIAIALISLGGPQSGLAETLSDSGIARHFQQVALKVERAFYRDVARLDATTFKQIAIPASLPDLQTRQPFAQINGTRVQAVITPLNPDQVRLCVTATPQSAEDAYQVSKKARQQSLTAVASDCVTPRVDNSLEEGASLSWAKILNRRDTPTPTRLSPGLPLQGVSESARPWPALNLVASEPGWGSAVNLTFTNPSTAEVGSPEFDASLVSLVSADIRDGFLLSHDCQDVPPQQQCTISLQYDYGGGDVLYGFVDLEFTGGLTAWISLKGTRQAP